MIENLAPFDVNLHRRRLHDRIFEIHDELGLETASIPHTFDTDALLAHADRLLRRRELRDTDARLSLLYRTAIVHAIAGDPEAGLAHFERGMKATEGYPFQSRFHFGIGMWHHFRCGRLTEAKEILLDGHRISEKERRIRTEIELLLGRTYRQLGEHAAAERVYADVLERGVLEYRAVALLWMANAQLEQGQTAQARRSNASARQVIDESPDWALRRLYLGNVANLAFEESKLDKARKIHDELIAEDLRRLDIPVLGRHYNNLALTCRRLGDVEAARESYAQAIRFHAAAGRPGLMTESARNLAILYFTEGDLEAGLAAIDRARDFARQGAAAAQEFTSLALAARSLADAGEHRRVPPILNRCREILPAVEDGIDRRALVEFVLATAAYADPSARKAATVTLPRKLASPDGTRRLGQLLGPIDPNEFEDTLERRLGDGMSFFDAPAPALLREFLLLFAGAVFKNTSYQREFGCGQARAKYHLQWLVGRRILEMIGRRKAAVYMLAFHRAEA